MSNLLIHIAVRYGTRRMLVHTSACRYTVDRLKGRLFRVARVSRRSRTYDDDKIDEARAMAEYGLSLQQLADLPKHAQKAFPHRPSYTLYSLNDVYNRALKVHGSGKAMHEKRRMLIDMRHKLSDSERMRLRMRVEAQNQTTRGADRVVVIAFTLNLCDTIGKFTAAYLTGSKSLFAEAIHSTMDTVNQLVLLTGIRFSQRNPDLNFPYGYGNVRYVSSLITGCGILSFGCGLSMYHGISGLLHGDALEPLTYAYYALFMSLLFQGSSVITAFREARRKAAAARISLVNYVRTTADPSLNVVLLEDSAAVIGVAIALSAVSLSSIFQSPVPDCCGSILIGCLLGTVASFIIRTNAAHLVGRSLPKRITDDIVCRLENDPMIRSVHDVKATALGVEQSRFKAELDFDGRAITNKYITESCYIQAMIQEARAINDEESLREFMAEHGEKIIDQLGIEVDRIEDEITCSHPDIVHVDLEAQ
uniref:Proton-coupled zinc antiporter SLC30A9, mitochondrial n=2 Tax=Parascaris univalens TaxID=6257 RepID=A0A915B661_PARUN